MNIQLEIPLGVLFVLFEKVDLLSTSPIGHQIFKRNFSGEDINGISFNFVKGDRIEDAMVGGEILGIVYSRYLQKGVDIERYNTNYPNRQVKNEDELIDSLIDNDQLESLSIPFKNTVTFNCWNIYYILSTD